MDHEQDRRRALGRESSSSSIDPGIAARTATVPGKRSQVEALTASSPAPIQRAGDASVTPGDSGEPAMPVVSRTFTVLQGGLVVQRAVDSAPPSAQRASSESGASAGAGSGRALPAEVRRKMESTMNADFSAVRIHEAPQAKAMGALACTQGSDVHFAPGHYDPHSQAGQALIGHEPEPPKTTESLKEQVDQALKQEGLGNDRKPEINTKLSKVSESDSKDTSQLVKLGIPLMIAAIAIFYGISLLLNAF